MILHDITAWLRAAGHVVHTPDLYDGTTFATLAGGVQYAEDIGFDTILERGHHAPDVVYIGLSLGAMPAQSLARTRSRSMSVSTATSTRPPSSRATVSSICSRLRRSAITAPRDGPNEQSMSTPGFVRATLC